MIGSARRTAGRPQQRAHSLYRYPPPIGGIDNRLALGGNDPNHCIYTYNLMPSEKGMVVRDGYREWQIDVDDGSAAGIHTMIPFNSETPSQDKLFAVNNEGIWDVTVYGATASKVATFSDTSADAGYGTFTRFVNQAEVDVMFYADNLNGLWKYTVSTNTWAVPTDITGLVEAEVNFVTVYKNNVWFGVRESTVGYYLPVLASSGTVAEQFFGDKFKMGGALKGLFNWTVDGGNGLDDILVVVSSAGDVIVYAGSGPAESDWGMKGIYYIGDIPNTPRFGSEQGGELYLLSSYGIISMNDLLQGVDTAEIMKTTGASMSAKIAGSVRADMKKNIDQRGWGVSVVPSQGGILLSTPQVGSEPYIQFFFNLATNGWGIWRGVPMQCSTSFNDNLYFGTADGRVMIMDSVVDNALLTPVDPPINGDEIEFSILTAFSSMGKDGVYKRPHLIRPDFISTLAPAHTSQIRFDYDITEGVNNALTAPTPSTSALWDTALWDTAIWGSDAGDIFPSMGGAWGYGRYCAVATKGTCRAGTNLIGWDVIYSNGGVMY
jgi:hypothetical protein